MYIIRYLRRYRQLRQAIKKAEQSHQKMHQRFYVTVNAKNNLIVINMQIFRDYKNKRLIDPRATIIDLTIECFYFTADKNGAALPPRALKLKRKMYFKYMEAEYQKQKKHKRIKEHYLKG